MSRGPRGPRKRTGPAKPKRVVTAEFEDDDEGDLRDTPEYRRRQAVIRVGTGILLFAFLSTSGITCIASGMSQKEEQRQQQQQQAENPGTEVGASALNAEIERYQGELKKNPSDTEAHRLLGQCLVLRSKNEDPVVGLKDVADAQTHFEAVLQSEPENMQIWVGLGDVNAAQNKPEKALEAYGKALELAKKPIDPKAPDKDSKQAESELIQVQAYLGQSRVHSQIQKKYDDALADLDAALKINSSEAEAYLLRGRVQIARKQPEAARRDLGLAQEIATQLPPGSEEQKYILSQYLAAMKLLDPTAVMTATASPSSTPAPETPTAANSTVGNTTDALNVTVANTTAANQTTPGNTSTP